MAARTGSKPVTGDKTTGDQAKPGDRVPVFPDENRNHAELASALLDAADAAGVDQAEVRTITSPEHGFDVPTAVADKLK
jgi:hypothetical protein